MLAYTVLDSYDATGYFRPDAATRLTSYVTRSDDGGVNWESPRVLDIAPFEWSSPYGKIIRIGDELVLGMYGGWLPVYQHGDKPEERKGNFAFVLRSRDGGVTWSKPEVIAQGFAEPGR